MTTQTEQALRMALRAMEYAKLPDGSKPDTDKAIAACKEALAAPQSTWNILMDSYNQRVEMKEAAPHGEPVAWRTFDGEGGYDYRTYEDNETYHADYVKRNGEKYATWVEPLYTHPAPAPQGEPQVWRDAVVVNLVREGVNKHRARELADHFATIHPAPAPLSDKEIRKLQSQYPTDNDPMQFARAIERHVMVEK